MWCPVDFIPHRRIATSVRVSIRGPYNSADTTCIGKGRRWWGWGWGRRVGSDQFCARTCVHAFICRGNCAILFHAHLPVAHQVEHWGWTSAPACQEMCKQWHNNGSVSRALHGSIYSIPMYMYMLMYSYNAHTTWTCMLMNVHGQYGLQCVKMQNNAFNNLL